MNQRLRDLPRTRMVTTGFKLFTGIALVGLTAALVNGVSTCRPSFSTNYPPMECTGDQGIIESTLGPVTVGWFGGVGDHFVFTAFFTMAAVSLFLAGFLVAFRDADPHSVAEAARTDVAPPVNPPSRVSYWPVLAAFSVAFMAIGLVANPATFVAGAVALGLCGLMWTLRTWAEHATGAHEVNEEIRERVAVGLEVPLIALLVAGAVAMSISRVLLTVGQTEAVIIAGLVAALFFVAGTVFAYVPKVGQSVVAAAALALGLLVVGAGIISATLGERDIEHHHTESPASDEVDDAESDQNGAEGDSESEDVGSGDTESGDTESDSIESGSTD
jgi:cbb3-type cytochrome oxidase subunit 3